mmetsp:Transcript_77060/g.152695  ORF Transcript_77060/g.152695 Transcript_77060/m.152695 type:complete len:394 (-) Transcript_77060:47-1228(-)
MPGVGDMGMTAKPGWRHVGATQPRWTGGAPSNPGWRRCADQSEISDSTFEQMDAELARYALAETSVDQAPLMPGRNECGICSLRTGIGVGVASHRPSGQPNLPLRPGLESSPHHGDEILAACLQAEMDEEARAQRCTGAASQQSVAEIRSLLLADAALARRLQRELQQAELQQTGSSTSSGLPPRPARDPRAAGPRRVPNLPNDGGHSASQSDPGSGAATATLPSSTLRSPFRHLSLSSWARRRAETQGPPDPTRLRPAAAGRLTPPALRHDEIADAAGPAPRLGTPRPSELAATLRPISAPASSRRSPGHGLHPSGETAAGRLRASSVDATTLTVAYKASLVQEECSICFETFAEGDRLRLLPCLHKYHADCVERWLVQKHTCPVCKLSLLA